MSAVDPPHQSCEGDHHTFGRLNAARVDDWRPDVDRKDERMKELEIQQRIREKRRAGLLRMHLPAPLVGDLQARETSRITRADEQHFCSACGEPIAPDVTNVFELVYSDGIQRFHPRCKELWDDERKKQMPRRA